MRRYGHAGASSTKAKTTVAMGVDGRLEVVSLVSANCSMLGVLGEGASGTVWECEYKGRHVPMRLGIPFNRIIDDDDQFELKQEIGLCNELLLLQVMYL